MQHKAQPMIMTGLKEETAALHEELERLPFHRALLQGNLSAEELLDKLQFELRLHHHIEAALQRQGHDDGLRALRSQRIARAALFEEDLFRLADHAARPPRELSLQLPALRSPSALAGLLYVVEGSCLGGQILSRSLRRSLNLAPDALQSLNPYGRQVARYWGRFCATMNRHFIQPPQQQKAIASAQACFTLYIKAFAQLETSPRHTAQVTSAPI